MEMISGAGLFVLNSTELGHVNRFPRKSRRLPFLRGSLTGNQITGDEAMHIFIKERQLSGDFISKASDVLWGKGGFSVLDTETNFVDQDSKVFEVTDDKSSDGFLKLTKTQEWVSGNNSAPVNKKMVVKEWQNECEKRKKLNLLKYDALKRELLLLTSAIGAACSGYCLLTLSVEAAVSYAAGVLFSCLYLRLLYRHTDCLSKEAVPKIFKQKKVKKIGIRSEDLKNLFERTVKGSNIALSSPRLVIPVAIYGLWGLSHHYFNNFFDFQLAPAMFGMFAYKAAALVQVYRDNEDLRFIFSDDDNEESY